VKTDFFPPPAKPAKQPTDFSFTPPGRAPQATTPFQPPTTSRPIISSPFAAASAPSPFVPPPPPPKPAAAKMSSLEGDVNDLTLSGSDIGMTQFGFKGNDGNRTSDFDQEMIRRKRRTFMWIGIAAGAGVLVLLIGLYFILRSTAPQPTLTDADLTPENSESLPTQATQGETPGLPPAWDESPAAAPESKPGSASGSVNNAPPFPDAVESNAPASAGSNTGLNSNSTVSQSSEQPSVSTSSGSSAGSNVGNAMQAQSERPATNASRKVSESRENEIMQNIMKKTWPNSASERLRMADDFNDLGRTAEANMAYQKALEASDAAMREKTLALGGLAVTYKLMGMKVEARRAVDSLLILNPRNRFAQNLRAQLE